jgi:formimidoylglutamate deiminase
VVSVQLETLRPEWCWTPQGLRRDVAIEIRGETIVALTEGAWHPEVPMMSGRLALPGLVNAHSHAFQRAFRGQVQWKAQGQDDFWSWRDRMYEVAGSLDPDGVEAISALCFLEMAQAGVTQVGEFHYLHHQPDGRPYDQPDELAERVIAAADRVGIRICLLRTVYLRGRAGQPLQGVQRRFGDPDAAAALAATERLRSRWATPGSRVSVGLAPHSVRAVDLPSLRELASFVGPLHAHVSEQPAENEGCLKEHGMSPLQAFEAAGMLHERFVAVHLTWPLPGDVARLVAAGAAICVCPSTELDLGDGLLPLAARTDARLCLGSDSHAQIDLLDEARALELHGRALAGRRNVLAPEGSFDGLAERLLRAASTDGARALGSSDAGLTVGAPADLVLLDLRRVAADGVPPLQAAAFVAHPEWTDEVWVAGRKIVEGGRHPLAEQIRSAARPYLRSAAPRSANR